MDRLHVGLDRVLVEQRRAVAAAFDEVDARHLGIACERFEVEDERLLDEAMDRQSMLGRIDVGKSGAGDHEMQAIRRDRAVEEVVWRARSTAARAIQWQTS